MMMMMMMMPSIVTIALCCIICEILVENRDFLYPLHSTPPLEGAVEYYHPVWYGKTRMVGLPDGEKTLRTCTTV